MDEDDIIEDLDEDIDKLEDILDESSSDSETVEPDDDQQNNASYNGAEYFKNNYNNNSNSVNRLNEVLSKPHFNLNRGSADDSDSANDGNQEDTGGIQGDSIESQEAVGNSSGVTKAVGNTVGNAAKETGKKVKDGLIGLISKLPPQAKIAIGVAILVVFIVIIIVVLFNGDDESDTSVVTNDYIRGNMDKNELIDYLSYVNICPNTEEIVELVGETDDIFESIKSSDLIVQSCKNAVAYYESIKFEYDENRKICYYNRNEDGVDLPNFWKTTSTEAKFESNPKALAYFIGDNFRDNSDCQIELPTQLIMETMSYGLTDIELFNNEYATKYVDYSADIRRITNALSEFVHESCWMWETKYYNEKGYEVSNSCDKCTSVRTKVNYDGYYFQISFDKLVSYLKFGDTSDHPNYLGIPVEKGKNHENECSGPSSDLIIDENSSANIDENDFDNGEVIGTGDGAEIAKYALQFVGNKYVYGGNSLTDGIDCSGFVQQVYKHFGISLQRTARQQANAGKSIGTSTENAKAGDLIYYGGHIGIYIGNGKMVHASNSSPYPKGGIKISDANYRAILTIRRIVE